MVFLAHQGIPKVVEELVSDLGSACWKLWAQVKVTRVKVKGQGQGQSCWGSFLPRRLTGGATHKISSVFMSLFIFPFYFWLKINLTLRPHLVNRWRATCTYRFASYQSVQYVIIIIISWSCGQRKQTPQSLHGQLDCNTYHPFSHIPVYTKIHGDMWTKSGPAPTFHYAHASLRFESSSNYH